MASYVTRNSEDVFSVVNKTIGDLNSVYIFLQENTSITLSSVPIGITVNYEVAVFQPPAVNSNTPPQTIVSQNYSSRQNQTIYDICLMTYTDLNKLYLLNFNNITTPPLSGSIFNFNPTKIRDNILKNYVSDNKVIFATVGATPSDIEPIDTNFLLRSDGGRLLRVDGGRFLRL